LRGRVDLVVVRAFREVLELGNVVLDPGRDGRIRQIDVARLRVRLDDRRTRLLAALWLNGDKPPNGGLEVLIGGVNFQ